jgi:hypothetical protein
VGTCVVRTQRTRRMARLLAMHGNAGALIVALPTRRKPGLAKPGLHPDDVPRIGSLRFGVPIPDPLRGGSTGDGPQPEEGKQDAAEIAEDASSMRKVVFAALVMGATLVVTPTAFAARHHSSIERQYLHAYREVVQRHGKQTAGRNLVRQGRRPGKDLTLRQSLATLRRMLYVPPLAPAHAAVAVAQTTAPAAPVQSASTYVPRYQNTYAVTGHYAIPAYIVQRESGGDYNAVNPQSGAFGAYQLLPGHFAPGGACAGLSKDPAGQDACAAKLWNGGAGSSNWAATR